LFSCRPFRQPHQLCYHRQLNLMIVADTLNHCIKSISMDSEEIRIIAGSSKMKSGHVDGEVKVGVESTVLFNSPMGVCVDEKTGDVFVADSLNHCIRCLTFISSASLAATATQSREWESVKVTTFSGTPGESGFRNGEFKTSLFNRPASVAYDKVRDHIVIADSGTKGDSHPNFRLNKILTSLA